MEIKVIGKAHSIPYSVALPLEWGSNNCYSYNARSTTSTISTTPGRIVVWMVSWL